MCVECMFVCNIRGGQRCPFSSFAFWSEMLQSFFSALSEEATKLHSRPVQRKEQGELWKQNGYKNFMQLKKAQKSWSQNCWEKLCTFWIECAKDTKGQCWAPPKFHKHSHIFHTHKRTLPNTVCLVGPKSVRCGQNLFALSSVRSPAVRNPIQSGKLLSSWVADLILGVAIKRFE